MHLARQRLDALGQLLGHFRQPGVLFQQLKQLFGGLRSLGLALGIGHGQGFAMLCVGVGLGFVAGGLTCLGQQDQRRGVGRLQAERQVEQNERVHVEVRDAGHVQHHPQHYDGGLRTEKGRRAEEARKGFGLEGERIVAEGGRQVGVASVETQMVDGGGFGLVGGHGGLGSCA